MAATAVMPAPQALASIVQEHTIVVGPGRAPLTGQDGPTTDVWTYDGKIPGPTLRLRQGEPARVIVENWLDEDTTVHWHGIRLPNAIDGVPGLTQAPIKPGDSFVYEFTPPDAGTFWYHPHANSLSQLGRGLAGALFVEEREALPVDRDLLWVITGWRLTAQGEIASGCGSSTPRSPASWRCATLLLHIANDTFIRHSGVHPKATLRQGFAKVALQSRAFASDICDDNC